MRLILIIMSKKHSVTKFVPTLESYTTIIDHLQDYAVFTIDSSARINSWNLGATSLFGYSYDEIMGEDVAMLFTSKELADGQPEKELALVLLEGKLASTRWYVRKDKTEFSGYGLVFPLHNKEDVLQGYLSILHDLSSRTQMETAIKEQILELELLNSHKEDVLSMLSHDLRSPLDGIIGIADYIKEHYETMDRPLIKEMLDHIYRAVKEEHAMLDYLVEWARIKQASEMFQPTIVELNQYVEKVFDLLKETASLNTVTLFHNIEFNNMVYVDGKMLLSIIQNILSNAIKHTNPGGKITVTAKQVDGKMIVQVEDNGDGMTDAIQEKLFKPQLKFLVKERKGKKGAGLGLLLVKSFLEKNGGEIWVESKAGVGSSFYFSLPLSKVKPLP
ncbi:MAG: hypothetical protein RL427_1065 [Bacteroidota bacterium]|jgi:two-component system CheB/CheR fusion protein